MRLSPLRFDWCNDPFLYRHKKMFFEKILNWLKKIFWQKKQNFTKTLTFISTLKIFVIENDQNDMPLKFD